MVPRLLGTVSAASSGALAVTLTTSALHAANTPIFVGISVDGSRSIASMSDSGGNSYTRLVQQGTGSGPTDARIVAFVSGGTNSLGVSSLLSISTAGVSAGGVVAMAFDYPFMSTTVNGSGWGSGASGEPSVSFSTASVSSVVFTILAQESGLVGSEYSEDSDYTTLVSEQIMVSLSVLGGAAFRHLSPAGSDTYNPTTTQNVKWALGAFAFDVASQSSPGASSSRVNSLLLLNVG